MFRLLGNAVIIGLDEGVGTYNNVWQIWSSLRPFTVDDEVFSILDGFRDIRVGVKTPGVGVEGFIGADRC